MGRVSKKMRRQAAIATAIVIAWIIGLIIYGDE